MRKAKGVSRSPVTDIKNRYDGASNGRRMGTWIAPSTGPNKAISQLQILRNRSRDAVRNEWQSASSLRVMVSNLIGTGIIPRPKTADESIKKRLTDLWDGWVKDADADGLLDYYGMQALATRCRREAGEVFLRARPRRPGYGMTVPVQIQLLEPEMVPLMDVDQWPGMPANNRMRQGVEFDRMGQRVAYWMHKDHPGDNFNGVIGGQDLMRIPAEFIKHVFKPLRIGQIRGVPEGATNLARLRVLTDFDDAVLARMHTANLFTGFVKKNAPTPDGIDPITGKAIDFDAEGAPMASLEPGSMQELLPGEDVTFANPPESGTNYGEYMRFQTLGISAGDGVPYELLSGDLKDVSDRAIRIVLNEYHRFCQQEQWHTIIPTLCEWVRDQWVKYALLGGVMTEADAVEARRTTWAPQAWAYAHPTQDVQARQLEVEQGFRSRASVIAELGEDPVAVDTERAVDQEREIALGIAFEPVDPNAPVEQTPQEQAKVEQTKAESTLILAKAKRELTEGEAEAKRLEAAATREDAEARMLVGQASLHRAEAKATLARADAETAESAARLAQMEHATASAEGESAIRVQALRDQAEAAMAESAIKTEALVAAEAFAKEQREIVLAAERTRAEVAALERDAAELGLAELRG